VRIQKEDWAGALADYNRAVEVDPRSVAALTDRGNLKLRTRDFDGAAADFGRAIDVQPSATLHGSRGKAKRGAGNLDGAFADYTRAIELAPESVRAYRFRGALKHDLRDWSGALADFEKIATLAPDDDAARIWIWLIRTRLGEPAQATADLAAHWERRQAAGAEGWAMTVVGFAAGRRSEAALLAEAASAGPQQVAARASFAYFLAGHVRLLGRDTATASVYFRRCVEAAITASIEYDNALAELRRLEGGGR
jgi:lipoprotein NlpI